MTNTTQIAVIGPGALGTLIAANLARMAPGSVTLVDHDATRARLLHKHGLTVESSDGVSLFTAQPQVSLQVTGTFEVGLVCVKAHAIPGVLNRFASFFTEERLLIVLANGIAHLDILAQYPHLSWAVGVTSLGAHLKAPGRVVHAGNGPTRIGCIGATSPSAQRLLTQTATLLSAAGLSTQVSTHIMSDIWGKLLVNVGINALTAIYDCANGVIAETPSYRQTLREAVEEAAAVALAQHIKISGDPVERAVEVCRATAANVSSMRQDVRNKRPTEIDTINGAIVRYAQRLGIPTPTNAMLVKRIKDLESRY